MKILANDNNKFRYPTWNIFTKLWKSTIFPCIKHTVSVTSVYKTYDENRIITIEQPITDQLLDSIIVNIRQALLDKNFDVTRDEEDLVIEGKNRDLDAPCIEITIYENELSDDEILEWDDARWASDLITDNSFKPSYQEWLDSHNLIDTYDNIRKAPKAIKQAYCDWFRAYQQPSEFCVDIMPINM
jgi:hypothetical protein